MKLYRAMVHCIFLCAFFVIVGAGQQTHDGGTQTRLARQEDHLEYNDNQLKELKQLVHDNSMKIEQLQSYVDKLTGGAILITFFASAFGLSLHLKRKES